jgi:hypothetical protein
MLPRHSVVSDPWEAPTQFDGRCEFAIRLENGLDGVGVGFIDEEHRRNMVAIRKSGKRFAPASRPRSVSRTSPLKLSTAQFRMLQSVPDDGLRKAPLASRASPDMQIQAKRDFKALRVLCLRGFVAQSFLGSEVCFEITDAGRALLRTHSSDPARPPVSTS